MSRCPAVMLLAIVFVLAVMIGACGGGNESSPPTSTPAGVTATPVVTAGSTMTPLPENGIWLEEGWNDEVVYGGPPALIEDAVSSIADNLDWIKVQREGLWLHYSPYVSPEASDLEDLHLEEVCWVKVSKRTFWSW